MADGMAAECPVAAQQYTQSRNNLRAARPFPYRLTRTHVFLEEDEFIPRDSRGFECEPSSKVTDSRELFKTVSERDYSAPEQVSFEIEIGLDSFGNIQCSFEMMDRLWIFIYL